MRLKALCSSVCEVYFFVEKSKVYYMGAFYPTNHLVEPPVPVLPI